MSAATVPAGTMTFFFTDVEGSTRLWETNHNAMALALARHDGIVRAAIVEHGGHIFKTGGDAFFAAFQHASDGLAAALTLQRRLATVAWDDLTALSVRTALHTGIAEARDDDYFGPALNRTARLLAAGYGGQMLLSKATRDALLGALPADVTLRDLGERRLKDLTLPEQIFQVIVPDLPDTFPPLLTLDARPNNLPAQQTSLIGRDAELETARRRLRQPDLRLLTLTGPGGTGKTRLSLQLAADVIDDYTHGVWFVSLAAVTDAEMVATEIAEALGVREEGGQSAEASVIEHLRERQLLLVLDNFEQVLAAAALVGRLIVACPTLTILVTSRAALHVYGEHEYPVPPLALPDRRRRPPLDQLATYPAIDLFVQRSRAVKPDFALTAENASAVADICARLDGLPLALELAASRSKILAPQAMLARLDSRLKLLTGGARDRPERQQTLRAAIAWSHDLLAGEEQTLFARLSVFTGSFTLDAAEQVVGGDLDVFDGVFSLVDKSLLRQEDAGTEEEPRFAMLATIREFGQEQLEERGETEVVRLSHAEHFLAFAEGGRPALRGPDQAAWLDRLQTEHDNIRLALDTFDSAGLGAEELRLADALWGFWLLRGLLSEGFSRLDRAIAAGTDAPDATMASALDGAGLIAQLRGDDERAELLFQRALALFRSIGDDEGAASALDNLGMAAQGRGDDMEAAAALFEEALTLRRAADDAHGVALSLTNLANHALLHRDFDRAIAHGEECVSICRDLDNQYMEALSLSNLADALRVRGELHRAVAVYGEALTLLRELGNQVSIADGLEGMAAVAIATGHTEQGVMLFGAVDTLRHETGILSDSVTTASLDAARVDALSQLGESRFQASWNEGAQMGALQAIDLALRSIASLSAARLPA